MVSQDSLAELSTRIARDFDPGRIPLLGSYARGNATDDSDVDLPARRPEDVERWFEDTHGSPGASDDTE